MFTLKVENLGKRFLLDHRVYLNLLQHFKGRAILDESHYLWVLKNINFEVKKGDCVGIMGENGAGKSTLLTILSGIMLPTEGHFAINGRINPFLDNAVTFKIELTAKENIYLNGSILGLSAKEIKRKFTEIVQFSELEKFIKTKLKFFSCGMKVRLGVSIGLAVDREILLLDEIIVGGDEDFREKAFKKLEQLRKEGKSILFVTHWRSIAEKYCNKILFISKGKQLFFGKTQNFLEISQKNAEIKKSFVDTEFIL